MTLYCPVCGNPWETYGCRWTPNLPTGDPPRIELVGRCHAPIGDVGAGVEPRVLATNPIFSGQFGSLITCCQTCGHQIYRYGCRPDTESIRGECRAPPPLPSPELRREIVAFIDGVASEDCWTSGACEDDPTIYCEPCIARRLRERIYVGNSTEVGPPTVGQNGQ